MGFVFLLNVSLQVFVFFRDWMHLNITKIIFHQAKDTRLPSSIFHASSITTSHLKSIPKISFKFCGIIPSRRKKLPTQNATSELSTFPLQKSTTPIFLTPNPNGVLEKKLNKNYPQQKAISKWWTFNLGKHGGKIQWNSRRDCRAAAALASVKQVDSSVSTPQATSSSTWTRPRKIYRRNAGHFMKLQHEWRWMKKESGWTLFTNKWSPFFQQSTAIPSCLGLGRFRCELVSFGEMKGSKEFCCPHDIHSRKLRWIPQMMVWKRYITPFKDWQFLVSIR